MLKTTNVTISLLFPLFRTYFVKNPNESPMEYPNSFGTAEIWCRKLKFLPIFSFETAATSPISPDQFGSTLPNSLIYLFDQR